MDEAWIVVNPISGSARRRRSVERFVAALAEEGVGASVHATRAPGDGARITRDAVRAGARLVVAAGGDGTVNEVARGLTTGDAPETALAILPLGTSNLVARDLRVPLRSPERAARGLATAVPIAVDVGEAGGRLFLACAGVGLDAYIVHALSTRRRGHIGYHSYVRPMWHALRSYAMPRLTVTGDDGASAQGELVLVLNARTYAAFLAPSAGASLTSGHLDVVVLSGRGLLRQLRWGWRAWRGSLGDDPDATTLRTRRVRIESADDAPFQIDGDVGGQTPVDMLVQPAALRVALPAAAGAPRPPTRSPT